ncbi:MAG: DUF3108 domain-containing protein [Nitrospirae bacterium]|nr:DUF3108 domain-containing protein [Nitrospirota bacterium]NTW66140.1 DUF3108 domain-containing protein [Nitrospirota bacterium]
MFSQEIRQPARVFTLILSAICLAGTVLAAERSHQQTTKVHHPFHPGEKLTYNISWSNVFSAGTAVMEVKKEKADDGGDVLRFISTARTTGMVDSVYTVRDTVQSFVNYLTLQSISYDLNSRHGKRKKQRKLLFDHEKKTVTYSEGGSLQTLDIPDDTQDALSSLYYIRSKPEFITGKAIMVDIHDSGKNWAIEVQVLGREKIKTPVGEFNTIKLKTYPKYEGVFMHKGEIFMWLTDDDRRIPVLMKSTITIGSIVATLTDMKLGDEAR